MIENLQDHLYQLKQKQVKSVKPYTNIRWELDCKKCSKTFCKVLERQNLQNQISLNYTLMIINQNVLAILWTFPNLQKHFIKLITPRRQPPKLVLLNFLATLLTETKSNEQFNLCMTKTSLGEIMKFLNSQTNNKSSGNDGLTAEFHKHFSNELTPVDLVIYDS